MSPAKPPSENAAILAELRGIRRGIDSLDDRITRGDARTDELVKLTAELGARFETMSGEITSADQRARNARGEILQTQTRAWQELDRKVDENAKEAGYTAQSLRERLEQVTREVGAEVVAPAMDAHIEHAADTAAAKVERKTGPVRKGLLGLSLASAGGGLVIILENAPKAAKAIHAAWVGMGAAGADLIK